MSTLRLNGTRTTDDEIEAAIVPTDPAPRVENFDIRDRLAQDCATIELARARIVEWVVREELPEVVPSHPETEQALRARGDVIPGTLQRTPNCSRKQGGL